MSQRVALVLSAEPELGTACAQRLAGTLSETIVVLVGEGQPHPGIVHRPFEGHDAKTIAASCAGVGRDLGPVEVLVVVAAHPVPGDHDDNEARRTPTLDAATVTAVLHQVARELKTGDAGRVVLVVAPGFDGLDPMVSAVSWGLIGLARAAARNLGPSGVTVNVVRTGLIKTAAMAGAVDAEAQPWVKEVVADTPLKRMGTIDDVAAAVEFLASPEASYLSGVVLSVDGGLTMGHTGA